MNNLVKTCIFMFLLMILCAMSGEAQKMKKEASDFTVEKPLFKNEYRLLSGGNIVELFEGDFPASGWRLANPNAGSLTFTKYNGVNGPSINGQNCIQMPFYSYGSTNHRDTLFTSVYNNPLANDSLIFDWAYQYYPSATYYDSLFVLISTDGGLTFPISVFRRGGPTLATAGSSGNNFVPSIPSQWQRFSYPLGGLTNVVVAFATLNKYGNNLYIDNVIAGEQKQNDIQVTSFITLVPDTSYVFGDSILELAPKVLISNVGLNNISTTFTVGLTIPELSYAQNQNVDLINSGTSLVLNYPNVLASSGTEMNIEISIDYADDQNHLNDTLRQRSVIFPGAYRTHVLYEQWTSSTCGPCASNNPTVDAFISSHADSVVAVKYHVGWPSPGNDPMYLHNPTQSYDRRNYYGVNSVPHIWVEGVIEPVYPYTTAGSLQNPFIERNSAPTPVRTVNVISSRPTADSIHSVVTVTVMNTLMSRMTNTYLRVQAVERVVEYASPPGTNGEKTFYDVFRHSYPTSLGTLLPAEPGTYIYEFTYKIDPVWIDTNIYTIAFVQNDNTHEVYGAGKSETTQFVIDVGSENVSPYAFHLEKNYPNPFNPVTSIKYSIPEHAKVRLSVYNVIGQKVTDLVNKSQSAGRYTVQWNGKDNRGSAVSSGIYFYRLTAGNKVMQNKMLLVK